MESTKNSWKKLPQCKKEEILKFWFLHCCSIEKYNLSCYFGFSRLIEQEADVVFDYIVDLYNRTQTFDSSELIQAISDYQTTFSLADFYYKENIYECFVRDGVCTSEVIDYIENLNCLKETVLNTLTNLQRDYNSVKNSDESPSFGGKN